jgi:hypothetical protein
LSGDGYDVDRWKFETRPNEMSFLVDPRISQFKPLYIPCDYVSVR